MNRPQHKSQHSQSDIFEKIVYAFRVPWLGLIWLYQHTISFDHGPFRVFFPNGYCRFYPSCSEYGRQAIQKHGVFKGWYLAIKRIIRCNPWNKGGVDEVSAQFRF